MGFAKGPTAATVVYDKAGDNRCVVHGDDFTFLRWEEDINDVRDGIKAKYKLKVRGGPWWRVVRPARGDDPQQEAPLGGR